MQKSFTTRYTQCGNLTLLFAVFVVMFSLSSTALTTFGINKPQNQPAAPTQARKDFFQYLLPQIRFMPASCFTIFHHDKAAAIIFKSETMFWGTFAVPSVRQRNKLKWSENN